MTSYDACLFLLEKKFNAQLIAHLIGKKIAINYIVGIKYHEMFFDFLSNGKMVSTSYCKKKVFLISIRPNFVEKN